ncbi:pericentrin isoform X3 [Hippocampus comes]|uniref:pericentrin isoform X3 n=1 Tax=Hippocampus comes TaxID=109280 RepID=UPI00094EB2D1|nr:PREDICTED: pericentrin-like isoform X3 [Hippocampus comes]
MDEDERQRKLEAGRAKKSSNMPRKQSLASFRQKRAKSRGAGEAKKAAKRTGPAVAQDDGAAQDSHIVPPPNHNELDGNSIHEDAFNPKNVEVQRQKDEFLSTEASISPVGELRDEELLALTSQEQLQLKQAVEKRNEIIAKLSSKLQEAQASRDEVQLEVQSLAGKVQALQKQLQQTSVGFQRLKNQPGADLGDITKKQQLHNSQNEDLSMEDTSTEQSGSADLGSRTSAEGFSTDTDTETDATLSELRAKLQEEKDKCLRLCFELEREKENHQHVLSLMEVERKDLQTQLSQVRSHCLEEKEVLDGELLQLRKKLQEEEESQRRWCEAEAAFTRRLQNLEDERLRQQEAVTKLKEEHREELERVNRLLEESTKEVMGLKASKNLQNQDKAGFSFAEITSADKSSGESGPDHDAMNVSLSRNHLMERYFAQSSLVHVTPCSQLDIASDQSFELNSDVFCDQPLLSISNCPPKEDSDVHDKPPGLCAAGSSNALWLNDSVFEPVGTSGVSEQLFRGTDLTKELLNQQCGELRQELSMKDHDLNVLREEVCKTTEELEEARSRWAQVTEELMEANRQLEEEKEWRRCAEEEMNLKSLKQDGLKNKTAALLEEKAAVNSAETSLLVTSIGENETPNLSYQNQQEMLEVSLPEISQIDDDTLHADNCLQTLQANYKELMSELEETKRRYQSTSVLLDEKTMAIGQTAEELQSTRAQLLGVQAELKSLQVELEKKCSSLQSAEKRRSELEAEIVNLEEAQALANQEKDKYWSKEEELSGQMMKMEQVLREELEHFENLLQAKDAELAEEREKWEDERQEKNKEVQDVREILEELRKEREEEVKALMERQVLAVEEATERLRSCHQQETADLLDQHQQEVSELNSRMETELLAQKAAMEQEQKRQISLIKQVTERQHERTVSELKEKHDEELSWLKTQVSMEVTESLEAAHQVEMEQARAKQSRELETLRLSLMHLHSSQLEVSQETALAKVQASLRDQHHLELEHIKEENEAQRHRLRELHQRDMEELKLKFADEKGSMEERQTKEINVLRSEWASEAERTQSRLQQSLANTQTELAKTQASLAQTSQALTEAKESLCHTRTELQKSKGRLETLELSSQEEKQKREEELKPSCADKTVAACSLEESMSGHDVLLQEREQQVRQLVEKQRQLQEEQVSRLQEEKDLMKKSSQEELGQLDSMRASRQELGELKEQLLARSSRVDDIERIKAEFTEQKREIKEQNEAELESLRRYFEQRLRVSEESYREEIALLQLKLVESALEESVLKTTDRSFVPQDPAEEETDDMQRDTSLEVDKQKKMLDTQMEDKHILELSDLQSSFKEELQQVRSDLADHYYSELQAVKNRHSLELEQLRAKLSDRHIQDITCVHMEVARQVEVEVELRLWCCTEELHTSLTLIHTLENTLADMNKCNAELRMTIEKLKTEFDQERVSLKEALTQQGEEEMRRMRDEHEAELSTIKTEMEQEKTRLQKAFSEEKENTLKSESPQALKTKHEVELQRKKSSTAKEMKELTVLLQQQAEERLKHAQDRFEEEKAVLEQCLAQKNEISLAELRNKHRTEMEHERAALADKHSKEMDSLNAKHKEQLDSLCTRHGDQLASLTTRLQSEHKGQLDALEAALNSKRKEDLEALEAVFQETSQAQLEAREAELARKHQEETDEIEKRMLSNMDTLEATYLKEVHALRDEMVQLEQRHHQDLTGQKAEHQHVMQHYAVEQEAVREELRKELAQMHLDKFRALAAELSQVHQTELSAQKESLDAEHCKALGTLKAQVLELEQQHSTALEELTQAFTTEKEQLHQQHQLQLQELKGASARELEACRRELEESSSRQRQHFLEEVEILKVQSGELLQDKIHHLKAEKEAELEDQRQALKSEQEEKERNYTSKMSQLTAQLQQLDAVVAQLRAEVGCLQGELEGKRAEMETLDTLLQRRERESQEGGNLLKMLTDDLQTAKEERHKLHQANDKLKKVLIEMLRSTVATEELIGKKINTRSNISDEATHQRSSLGKNDVQESGISVADLSLPEDLELTHQLCESLLVSDMHINPGGEEAAMNACNRLHHTVDTLLDLLNQANAQLEQTHHVHLSLEERFAQGQEDSAQLLKQHNLLLLQIDQEVRLKSQLELEFHKAEGLLEGYVADKAGLEEALLQKEAQEERLVEELEDLRRKAHQTEGLCAELENLRVKHQELSEEHAALLRQKEHLSAGLGEREKGLLAETERLTQDRLDLQRQAEKDHSFLSQRLRTLERELEEQEMKGQEELLHHKNHIEDLSQQVQALEKQLKHNRQFIEEQAVEREHERDEFQQEIRRLESQLRQMAGGDVKGHRFEDLVLQVESLQAIIKDKLEDHASLAAANQLAQRELAERNEEIDKLAVRIRELEQALLSSAECNGAVGQLEQELHRAKLREEELTQDKQALEQQQLSNRLQISALQSKLDETRHCYHNSTWEPTQELRDALDAAQQSLQTKEQEADVLLGQLDNVQRDLSIKEAELKHLTLQLERLTSENTAHVNELQEQIEALKEHLSALSILAEEKEGQRTVEDQKEETLPSALLEEKNHEIDHLTTEIERLQEELGNTNNKDLEAELHDLSSQVEHLRSEIARLRQDRRDEEERLHEVISTLQAELSTLGPNVCEVSDSQDGDSINPSPTPSPEPQGGPSSLKHELSLTHSTSSRPLRSRLKALQSQLETAVAEKEALEHLLLTQEEEYRGHGEEFGRRLKAEREKADELRGLLALKEAELVGIEEERSTFRLQVQQVDALQKERDHLSILVTQLQQKEQDLVREVEGLKTQEQEMKTHSLTLEAQVQRLQAEVAVAEKQARVDTALETVRAELLDEREALRKREGQLQEEIERLKQEAAALTIRVEELTSQLPEQQTSQEDAQKELLTHAEETLAKTDAALRLRETELARLGAEHQALREELTTVKQDLSNSTQRAEKLCEEGQSKDRAVADLENDNRLLKVELERLREDLNAQEETLVHQERELHQTRLRGCQSDMLAHHEGSSYRDVSQRAFEDIMRVYRDSISLSSPEVLQHLECSEDFLQEQFPASILGSRLSELSALELDHPRANKSPVAAMEPPLSRTITPDLSTQSSHSPRSLSVSDNFSIVDSVSAAKVCDLEGLDQTAPPSPLGSTSSISVQEWASDGYGSNVSSELGARLRVELDQTERLDAQFVEYLRCRGMNPTANTDSAAGSMSYSDDLLSPELQALLRKVYQEGCRLLTLSQRRASSSFHPSYLAELNSPSQLQEKEHPALLGQGDKLSSNPPMGWQEEKRALQKTVITLRELLCRMAQRHAPADPRGDADREHLQAESQTRSELEETQKQLKYAHETQLEQKNKIQALGLTVEECEETLTKERALVQELKQQLERERALNVRQENEVEQRLEVMRASSEQQRAEMQSLQGLMEQETVACSNLRRELQIEQSRSVVLEKRLDDLQKKLEDERQHSAEQREENTRLERLLTQSESRLAEIRSKLADSHRALDEELERCSKQMDDINRRHEVDGARDRKFISDLRLQLEEERRRGEELAALADKLRAEVLESRRRLDEDKTREEALREQKRKVDSALEAHRAELSELKDRMQLLKNKEREWERERQKGSQEQMERERRQESTNNKLRDLELLRQQDRQRMEELQHTLSKLQREQRDMAAQRMSGQSADAANADVQPSQHRQQVAPTPSSGLLEKILSKNAELTHTLTSLSQEKTALKHKVTCLERQLHRAENELAKVPIESENIPISEMAPSKVQRLYERYLRAESFRKALVYQKRYLLLLLGGFKECEQATLCLIATMGARPSPLPPCRRPLGRFRSAVRVVIAISRMKFLTRKWHKAIRRLPGCATVNVHAPGLKGEVLREQQQQQHQRARLNSESPPNRDTASALVSPSKSHFRLHNRSCSSSTQASAAMSQEPEKSLTEYINHLEKVQHRLVGSKPADTISPTQNHGMDFTDDLFPRYDWLSAALATGEQDVAIPELLVTSLPAQPSGWIFDGSTVDDWLAYAPHSSDVMSSNLGCGLPVWGLHALPVPAWVYSEYYNFLPHTKNMHGPSVLQHDPKKCDH